METGSTTFIVPCEWRVISMLHLMLTFNIILDYPYILLPDDVFQQYANLTGLSIKSVFDADFPLTVQQYKALKPLHFDFGTYTITLDPDAQIFPRKSTHDPIISAFVVCVFLRFSLIINLIHIPVRPLLRCTSILLFG